MFAPILLLEPSAVLLAVGLLGYTLQASIILLLPIAVLLALLVA